MRLFEKSDSFELSDRVLPSRQQVEEDLITEAKKDFGEKDLDIAQMGIDYFISDVYAAATETLGQGPLSEQPLDRLFWIDGEIKTDEIPLTTNVILWIKSDESDQKLGQANAFKI